MGDAEKNDEQRPDKPVTERRYHEDRRTSTTRPAGVDPRDIDQEYSSEEQLEVTLKQDKMNRPRQGHQGMGTSSDRAPGTDLDEAQEPPAAVDREPPATTAQEPPATTEQEPPATAN